MFYSLKYSNIFLRLGLSFVFFWFGIDKFIHPNYWLNAWVPEKIINFIAIFQMQGSDLIFISGIFEILAAISLLTNIFIGIFSFLASLYLVGIMIFHGMNEVLIRDIGLFGGLVSVFFWPHNRRTGGLR